MKKDISNNMNETAKETRCRLCLATVLDKDFKAVDKFTKTILDIPLLTLKLENGSPLIMCNFCYGRLNAVVEFKSTCLAVNNTIVSYANCDKMLQIDLREVYVKAKTSEQLTDISGEQKVCRLCMQLVASEFRSVCDEELRAIQIFLPEINTNIVKDPIVCTICINSLCTHNSFLKKCSEVEKKIGDICANQTAYSPAEAEPLEFFIKTDNLKQLETDGMNMPNKIEYVEVKSEYEGRSDFSEYETSKACHSTLVVKNYSINQNGGLATTYKCEKCNYETVHCGMLQRHASKHKKMKIDGAINGVFKCDICSYESYSKHDVVRHELTHKTPPERKMYKCDLCDYKTNYKWALSDHQVTHKPFEEQLKYKALLAKRNLEQYNNGNVARKSDDLRVSMTQKMKAILDVTK